ncbi:MAG: hypothetical protein ACRDTN_14485, partial [Mycobacterium sp.]
MRKPSCLTAPTSWYPDWVGGFDVFDVERDSSPAEMPRLVYQKPGRTLGRPVRSARTSVRDLRVLLGVSVGDAHARGKGGVPQLAGEECDTATAAEPLRGPTTVALSLSVSAGYHGLVGGGMPSGPALPWLPLTGPADPPVPVPPPLLPPAPPLPPSPRNPPTPPA